MTAAADRHLLFGLLALQNGLIDQSARVAAFQAWTRDKTRSLADQLVARSGLDPEQRLGEAMVGLHLKKHGGNVEKSLAAIPLGGPPASRSPRWLRWRGSCWPSAPAPVSTRRGGGAGSGAQAADDAGEGGIGPQAPETRNGSQRNRSESRRFDPNSVPLFTRVESVNLSSRDEGCRHRGFWQAGSHGG